MPHVVETTSGVRQGSILVLFNNYSCYITPIILIPVLFNLNFKDAEMIAESHGFSLYSYADDM